MTDLTKWLPLWDKCPELELGNIYYDDGLRLQVDGTEVAASGFSPCWVYHTDGGESECDPTDAADLIFARAIQWLAEQNRAPTLDPSYTVDGKVNEWLVLLSIADFDDTSEFTATTPVEAVYLACCHVLGVTDDVPRVPGPVTQEDGA